MELALSIYLAIGFIFGLERLSRVTENDTFEMVNIGIIGIIVLWPFYIVYKILKK